MTDMPETVTLTRAQAVQLVSLWALVREGKLMLSRVDGLHACDAIKDIAEECALQLGGMA